MTFPRMLALVAVVIAPSAALAQGGTVRSACQNDIRTLCGSLEPGGGRIRDCMRQHRTELSASCKVAIADRMLERAARKTTGAPGASVIPVPAK